MKMFYIKNKKILNFISAVVISFGFLGMAKTCYALEVIDAAVTSLLGSIAQIIVSVCSSILLRVIGTIIEIAKYNSFINNEQIKDAWIIIRDICNMFFILILLVIAFATILRVETYNAKKLLPKLIIMAVLINFSRTICGLLIDASQLVMLTFVNAFTDGDGNFISLLKVDKFLSLAKNTGTWHSDDSINLRTTVAGIIIAVLFMVIATVALLAILIIFIVRVVMLWIYVVLSPLAFLLSSFPEGQKYASQWWGEFIRYLINGPVLAFFIWLALVTMSKLDVNSFATKFTGGQVEMLEPANFMSFIIAIGMLVGGLMVSQQIGGIGASWGANTVKKMSEKGIGFAKKGALLPLKGGAIAGGFLSRKFAKHAFEIRPTKIIEGIKESFERRKNMDELAVKKRGAETLGKGGLRGVLGGIGAGQDWADRYFQLKVFQNAYHDIKAPSRIKPLKEEYGTKEKEIERNSEEIAKYANFQTTREQQDKINKRKNLNTAMDNLQEKIDNATGEEKEELEEEYNKLSQSGWKLDEEISIPISSDKEKLEKIHDRLKEDLRGVQLKIRNISLPKSFEARAAYRSSINEEKNKLKDITNSDELLQLFFNARQNKDKYRMAAIAEKLFNDANGNELLNDLGYDSDAIGLHKFVHEQLIDTKLLSRQEGLQLQNDLSETAERVNHWEMAKTVGINQFGELESLIKKDPKTGKWDDSAHAHAAAAEIFKIDPQGIMRMLNRLAFGGESPDGKGGKTFNLSTLGMVLANGLKNAFVDHDKRILTNTAFNLSQTHVQEQLRQAGVPESTINIFIRKGTEKGKSLNPGDIIAELKQKELHLKSNNHSDIS